MPDQLEAIAAVEAERSWNEHPDERATLLAAVDAVVHALEVTGVDHVWVGGIASAVYGRPRVSHDVDVLVRPTDARRLLRQLDEEGFATEERAPHWLFKAHRGEQEVDVLFRAIPDVFLDASMLAHARSEAFEGRTLQLVSPEDLVVIKAAAAAEHAPRHWHDALAILAAQPVDWAYLLERARHCPRRILSLLWYSASDDHVVPAAVLRSLTAQLLDEEALGG